jgi:hypothetical protein
MSCSKALRLAAITSFLGICLSLPARAEPVILTAGSFEYGLLNQSGTINFFGIDGFSLIGFRDSGNVEPEILYPPGAVARFSGSFLGGSTNGVLTHLGQTFTHLGTPNSNNHVIWSFSSSTFTLPPAPTGPATITRSAPFTLMGTFSGWPGDGTGFFPDPVIVEFLGTGIGSVSFTFHPLADVPDGGVWDTVSPAVLRITSPAEVVPEPGTLVLIGLGLAGAYGERYRRSRRATTRTALSTTRTF